ncbi:hypothetical protein BH10PSE19_BH10PSE19_19930 [soil metagenome]
MSSSITCPNPGEVVSHHTCLNNSTGKLQSITLFINGSEYDEPILVPPGLHDLYDCAEPLLVNNIGDFRIEMKYIETNKKKFSFVENYVQKAPTFTTSVPFVVHCDISKQSCQ